MKPTRFRAAVLLTAFLLASGRSAQPRSEIPPPREEEVAGVWVGFDQDFLHFFRIELAKQGTGVCAMVYLDNPATIYNVQKWSLDGISISFELASIDEETEPISLSGQANRSGMLLDVASKVNKWKRKVSLVREEAFAAKNRKAKESIERFRSREK